MLRVDVDARMLRAGGIGRYIRGVVGPWLCDHAVESVRLYGRTADLDAWLTHIGAQGNIEIVAWGDPTYSLSAQARWPRLSRRGAAWRPDVSFFPHFDAPLLLHPRPSAVVVHDLIHLRVPTAFPFWKRRLAAGMIRRVARLTDQIVTVSESSRADILAFVGPEAPPVDVVRNGVSDLFTPGIPDGQGADPFLLVVAPHKPHKNLLLAAQVLLRLRQHEGWRLVLVGPNASDRRELAREAGAPGLVDAIDLPGRVADQELRNLYRRASVVLVPSLLEGFALPALEARACGTRVLASDVSWAGELSDMGVELVAGWDPDTWTRAVRGTSNSTIEHASSQPTIPRWSEASAATLSLLTRVADQSPLGG